MSTTTAQFAFAAEFLTMVVAASGLILVALRSALTTRPGPGRAALVAGFTATGAVAFVDGARLAGIGQASPLGGLRLAGALALAFGASRWREGRAGGIALGVGALVEMLAAGAQVTGQATWVTDTLLVVAGILVGGALVAASRSSVAARVATTAASTLLLVVVVLSVALGAVITSSLQRDALARAASDVRAQGSQVSALTALSGKDARFVADDLVGYFRASRPNPLVGLGGGAGDGSPESRAVGARLREVTRLYPLGGFAYADPTSAVVASTVGTDPGLVGQVLRAPALAGTTCGSVGTSSAVVVGGRAWLAAAFPLCLADGSRQLGTVLSVRPLDAAFLADRVRGQQENLAVVTPTTVLATAGGTPPGGGLPTLVARSGGQPSTQVVGGQVVGTAPVLDAGGTTVATLVLSLPATAVVATRDELFRTLFLIALGGTVLALGLAAAIGDRITAGLRSLTVAARRVQAGDTATRAGVGGPDEVGLLGNAFDSMVVAIEEQTVALQGAADDEIRLRNRLEAVVAGMGEALVATDPTGRVTDVNLAAEKLIGCHAAEALGRPVAEVVDLVDDDGAVLAAHLARPGPARWAATARLRSPSAPAIPVAVSSGALRGPAGEVAGAVLVLRDLRREQEVERMKTEFLSRVGHELRTPLTGILGYADLLVRHDVPSDRATRYHAEILSSAKRLVRVVEMLEFFAASGAGRVALRPEVLPVRLLLEEVVATWSERLPPGVDLVRRVARDAPDVVADRRWLGLAIDELIDNAVKFSPDGGRIRLSVAPSPPTATTAGRWVDIVVSDQGKGMTPEQQVAAFGEFAQGDASDTRSVGGLGLGLSMVRRVVAGQGGVLRCSSAPGRGSALTIRLPAAVGTDRNSERCRSHPVGGGGPTLAE